MVTCMQSTILDFPNEVNLGLRQMYFIFMCFISQAKEQVNLVNL